MFSVEALRPENVWLGTYENNLLMKSQEGVLAVPFALASWDLSKKGFRYNPRILDAPSVSALKVRIDGLLHSERKPAQHSASPQLKTEGFRGHNICYYESRYFAIPQTRVPFDIEAFR